MEAILLIFDAVVVQKRGKATMAHGAHGELFFIDLPDYPGLRCDTLARSTLLFSCGMLHPWVEQILLKCNDLKSQFAGPR